MVEFYNDLLENLYKLETYEDTLEYEKLKLYQSNIEGCISEFVNLFVTDEDTDSDQSYSSSSEDESLLVQISKQNKFA